MSQFSGRELACFRGGRQVFTGLEFTLDKGDALLLTGPNGSGKSSLLRLMAGFLRPNAGRMTWAATSIYDDLPAFQAHLHYVGHADAVKGVLSVAENLGFWAQIYGGLDSARNLGPDAQERILSTALEALDLMPLARVPGRLLSSGQRRRLALARLLASASDLWLLDEPSVGLDKESVGALAGLIQTHREKGGVVVAATHTDLLIPHAKNLKLEDFAVSSLPEMIW